ncbi:PLD nuclease N-terminal domain-containing protein [Stackebrandtia soli]|uniref:PLD nuclease N-terminal domain-containing protein n=1 Tax=Stackebrandtia soli TaxID=1892856 RepID=UPI0039EC77C4
MTGMIDGMGRIVIVAAVIHLALLIAALADCLGGDKSPRRLSRGMWTTIIIVVPVIGAIAWFTTGRPRPNGTSTGRGRPVTPPRAPDDDPDFLRDLERKIREDKDKPS